MAVGLGYADAREGRVKRGVRKANLGALCVALLACDDEPEVELRDTERRTFAAVCPEAEPCVLKQKSGPGWPGDEATRPLLHSEGRLVTICSQPQGAQSVDARRCRAIECTRHRDCPPAHGQSQGACLDGLCSEPSGSFGQFDVVVLCLAGLGLGYDSPKQVENYALAVNCGNPCRLPRPCRN